MLDIDSFALPDVSPKGVWFGNSSNRFRHIGDLHAFLLYAVRCEGVRGAAGWWYPVYEVSSEGDDAATHLGGNGTELMMYIPKGAHNRASRDRSFAAACATYFLAENKGPHEDLDGVWFQKCVSISYNEYRRRSLVEKKIECCR